MDAWLLLVQAIFSVFFSLMLDGGIKGILLFNAVLLRGAVFDLATGQKK